METIAGLAETHKRLLASISECTQADEESALELISALRKENSVLRDLLESRAQDFEAEAARIQKAAEEKEAELAQDTAEAMAELELKAATLVNSVPVHSPVDSWVSERGRLQNELEEAQLACMLAQRELDLLKSGPVLTRDRMIQSFSADLEQARQKLRQIQSQLAERTRSEGSLRSEVERLSQEPMRLRQRIESDKAVLVQQTQDLHRIRRDIVETKASVGNYQRELAATQAEFASLQAHFSLLQAQYNALHTRVRGLRL